MTLPIVSPLPFNRNALMQFVQVGGLPGATNKITGELFQAVENALASVLDTIQRVPGATYESRLVDLQNVWSSLQ